MSVAGSWGSGAGTGDGSVVGGSLSEKWDCEWGKCIVQGQSFSVWMNGREGLGSSSGGSLGDVWKPGSIEGIWEGMFTVSLSIFSNLSDKFIYDL